MDFDIFLKKIIQGDTSVQEPIVIHNKTGDTFEPLPTYLTNYKNINKDNLLDTLQLIMNLFRKKVHTLNQNENIHSVIMNTNQEWQNKENFLDDFKNPLPENFLQNKGLCKKKYNQSCDICKDVVKSNNNEKSLPIESRLRGSHPLQREIDGATIICTEAYQFIQNNLNEVNTILKKLKSFDLSLLLDLSQKHKSHYILNNENCNPNDIPENIHKIFSNYIIVQNLFIKNILNYKKYLESLLINLDEHCININKLKGNIGNIAQVNIYDFLPSFLKDYDNDNNDDDDYGLDNLDDSDDEKLIQSILNINKTNSNPEQLSFY